MLCNERRRGRNVHGVSEKAQVDCWGWGTSASFLGSQEAGRVVWRSPQSAAAEHSQLLRCAEHSANEGCVLLLLVSKA